MTVVDPHDPLYLDELSVRTELVRVHDVCAGCRQCVDVCSTFPTLFSLLDSLDAESADVLTPAQQDSITDTCFSCNQCVVECPYSPDEGDADSELAIDMASTLLRARAMQFEHGHLADGDPVAARTLARAGWIGSIATTISGTADRWASAPPGSRRRRALTRLVGVSSRRELGEFADRRFSQWFADRPTVRMARPSASVTVVPTCLVEYQATSVGTDLVRVYERNGIECSLSESQCCGAALLHGGDVEAFSRVATRNVAMLADEVRRGTELVVAETGCAHVIRHRYPQYVTTDGARADAELVAEHTHDASEFLASRHRSGEAVLDTDFDGDVVDRIAYHPDAHVASTSHGFPGRDLMRLTGADIDVVRTTSEIGGLWSLRTSNDGAIEHVRRLAEELGSHGADLVVADGHLDAVALAPHLEGEVVHPLRVLAAAYGMDDER